ncbi:MAG: hypothetical protein AAFX93_12575 [Verrucomicrobiota bacterium]
MQPTPTTTDSKRGSVLIAAILFTMVAFIMVGTMLPAYMGDYRMAVKNRLLSSSFALAEAGGEEAIWSAYQNGWDTAMWDADRDWTKKLGPDGAYYYVRRVQFPGVTLGGEYTGYAKVAVKEPVEGQEMEVIAQGIVVDGSGADILNQIVQIDTDQLKPFIGFVSKDTMDLGSGTILAATNTNDFASVPDALNGRDSDWQGGSLSTSDNSVLLSSSNSKTQAGMTALQIGNVLTGASVFGDAVTYNGNIVSQTTNYTANFPSVEHPSSSGNNGPSLF